VAPVSSLYSLTPSIFIRQFCMATNMSSLDLQYLQCLNILRIHIIFLKVFKIFFNSELFLRVSNTIYLKNRAAIPSFCKISHIFSEVFEIFLNSF